MNLELGEGFWLKVHVVTEQAVRYMDLDFQRRSRLQMQI